MPLKKSFYLLLAVAIIGILPHAADAGQIPVGNTLQLTLTGVNGANDGHYYIDPYKGSINGGSEIDIWCVDFVHESYIGTKWTVNVTPVSGTDFSSAYKDTKETYLEILWLIGNYYTSGYSLVEAQHAIWSYSGYIPSASEAAHIAALKDQAYKGVGDVHPGNWNILTPDPKGGNQEFIIDPKASTALPEPGFLLLLALGIGAVSVVNWLAGGSRQ